MRRGEVRRVGVPTGLYAFRGTELVDQAIDSSQPAAVPTRAHVLVAWEMLIHAPVSGDAVGRWRRRVRQPIPAELRAIAAQLSQKSDGLRGYGLGFYGDHLLLVHTHPWTPVVDLSSLSRSTGLVLRALADCLGCLLPPPERLDRTELTEVLGLLLRRGVLAPPRGQIDWGDLGRDTPICGHFGYGRGVPVDRHYLGLFLDEIRDQVRGRTLEIGGTATSRATYGFTNPSSYAVLDIAPGPGVDRVGDVHDATLFPAASFDSIVILNVLEHCRAPWQVARVLHAWLAPAGKVFCVVPGVQRVHRAPADYWRLLPDGLESLFSDFATCDIRRYGNPATALAALMGIPIEEVPDGPLQVNHPDYPVTVGLVASKA